MQNQLEPVFAPLLQIVGLPFSEPAEPSDAVVFSSTNGVRHGPLGDGRLAFCVGAATTQAAQDAGWMSRMAGQTADELVETLSTAPDRPTLVHISGQHTRGDIVGRLSDAGYTIRHAIVYDQALMDMPEEAKALLSSANAILIPVFSPRSAQQLRSTAPTLANAHIIALSRPIAVALGPGDCASLTICETPTAEAMRKALLTWLANAPST